MSKKLGPLHPDALDCARDLIERYQDSGDYGRAAELAEQYVQRMTQLHGDRSVELAPALSLLADSYLSDGQLAKAEAASLKAVKLTELAHGDKSTEVLKPLGKLEDLFEICENYSKAEKVCQRTLSIAKASSDKGLICDQVLRYEKLLRMVGRDAEASRLLKSYSVTE